MTTKELKRLSRSDLLEMMLELSRENETLREENRALRQQLEDRRIALEDCSSLAEAALKLNGIFEAAHNACRQYAENVKMRCKDMENECEELKRQTQEQCDRLLLEAETKADSHNKD